jgi:hypothetical protein
MVYIEQLTSALYLEHRDDAGHYLEVISDLTAQALTPAGAARFVAEIIRGI